MSTPGDDKWSDKCVTLPGLNSNAVNAELPTKRRAKRSAYGKYKVKIPSTSGAKCARVVCPPEDIDDLVGHQMMV